MSFPCRSVFATIYRGSRKWRLTLFGRSLLLIVLELLANAACWIVTGILFARRAETRGVMSLALLAWTIGLRHGLDADHISAIDNATRGLIGLGQLPVTCGLFFSLGHSTIVIVVNVAIAISTDVYDKINGVGTIGGIVGTAVSGSFLFLIGLANSIILYRIIRNRRRRQRQVAAAIDEGRAPSPTIADDKGEKSLMMRVLGPVTTFVNKPWKMYPVGVLFGFGFDTASSIALLAVSALAKKDSQGKGIPQADIVILPFLFTVGMTLVDSADSILMLYSYAGFPERSLRIFERVSDAESEKSTLIEAEGSSSLHSVVSAQSPADGDVDPDSKKGASPGEGVQTGVFEDMPELHSHVGPSGLEIVRTPSLQVVPETAKSQEVRRNLLIKENTMSGLSIVLTLISILVAFSISLIEIMGLIGDNCGPCQRAANDPDGGGLAGSWWRGWAKANDESGFIGAAIVGGFVFVVIAWYTVKWAANHVKAKRQRTEVVEA